MDIYKKLTENESFFLIAGPCVLETADMAYKVADFLLDYCRNKGIYLIFKSSYRKANRSSLTSATGPGLQEGLKILEDIKKKFDLPILTDVHETSEVAAAAEVADILQIPAFLCRQTDLIIKAAQTGRIVNIKKGQFLAPEDMRAAAEKASSTGNNRILLTERGSSFGYHDLVVDFRSFSILNELGYPVIYDVTHSLQKPSTGKETGGTPQFAAQLAQAALATGMVRGLFIETHPEPSTALSDASTQLKLDQLPQILDNCLKIDTLKL